MSETRIIVATFYELALRPILEMKEEKYPLNRDEAGPLSFNEADDHVTYWSDKTEEDRLNAACFIINHIFNVTAETKVDRSIIDNRKFS